MRTRYERAIERNLAELQRAILNRTTLLGLEDAGGLSSVFLQVTYFALINDYLAHCIKVFDRGRQAASFWYIYRTDERPFAAYAKRKRIDIAGLEEVSSKLKHIRDKTHFHIDSDAVVDPKAIWRSAGLSGKELSAAVDAAWGMLSELASTLNLEEVVLPAYCRKDAHRIASAIQDGRAE